MSKFKYSFPYQHDEKTCRASKFVKISYEPDAKEGLKIAYPYMEVKEAHCPRCNSEINLGACRKTVCACCGLFLYIEDESGDEEEFIGLSLVYRESADRLDEYEAEMNKKAQEQEKIQEQRRSLNAATKELLAQVMNQLVMN